MTLREQILDLLEKRDTPIQTIIIAKILAKPTFDCIDTVNELNREGLVESHDGPPWGWSLKR